MAVPNLGDLVVTTFENQAANIADTITNEHAVLNYMARRGNVTSTSSGRQLWEPVIYGANNSVKWYDNYEVFTPPTTQEVVDAAVYDWRQQGGFIAISGKEEIMNSGKAEKISLATARIKQLMANLKNDAGQSVYSTGTGSGGKEFGGLQLLVADDPTAAGTVGGISQATNTWWRNYANLLVAGSATTIGAALRRAMNVAWLNVSVGTESPDLITMDANCYNYYESTLQELVRFTQTEKADSGFMALKYKNADVVYDAYCPTDHAYLLNTDTLFLRAAPGRMWTRGDKRTIQNADYDVIPVWMMGNLVVNNRRRNGVLKITVS